MREKGHEKLSVLQSEESCVSLEEWRRWRVGNHASVNEREGGLSEVENRKNGVGTEWRIKYDTRGFGDMYTSTPALIWAF